MRVKGLLVITAIIAAVLGIVFIALRDYVMGIVGTMGAGLSIQILGANFIGFAILNFFARNLPEGEGLRAVLLANFGSNLLGLLITVVFGITSGLSIYGWIAAGLYLILTLAFGVYLVYEPRRLMATVPCPQEPC